MIRARQSKSAPVGVVGKVLRILEALDGAHSGLSLHQIAQQTGIHKSTAYRFLAHLESEGYLYRDDAGAYIVGPKLVYLGAGMAYHATLRKIGRPFVQQIWKRTKETVNLGVLDGHEVLYLDVMESRHAFRMVSQAGMRRPLSCTALGKAMLAFLPAEQKEEILSTVTFERFTSHTVTNLPRLRKDLLKVYQQGFAIDDQETDLGARCIAAPIRDKTGKVVAAVSISGPVTRVSRDQIQFFADIVKKGARVISAQLGHAR
jgi:IclR family KDG regulon transcriptional repressor